MISDKNCEICGKLMKKVRGNRRFCGACMQERRKVQLVAYREKRKKHD